MAPLPPGAPAPPIPGAAFDGPKAVLFYKVTCPVCQMAAPKAQSFETGYPGRIVGVGEDPPGELEVFAEHHVMHIPTVSEPPPYETSEAYGVRSVPTLFLVDEGTVVDTVEGWDRDGYNRVSERLAELTGSTSVLISEPGDGLPAFRPG